MNGRAGIGVDVEPVDRFTSADSRLFTAEELADCERAPNPANSRAGRWCAKEAVVKALSQYVAVGLREVQIRSGPGGRPVVVLLRPGLADSFDCDVSISYTSGLAMAVALAWPAENAGERSWTEPTID